MTKFWDLPSNYDSWKLDNGLKDDEYCEKCEGGNFKEVFEVRLKDEGTLSHKSFFYCEKCRDNGLYYGDLVEVL